MNTDTGEFVEDSKAEKWMQRLDIGEVVKLKGEECEVVAIEDREVRLKLMNSEDRRQHRYNQAPRNRNERRKELADEKRARRRKKRVELERKRVES